MPERSNNILDVGDLDVEFMCDSGRPGMIRVRATVRPEDGGVVQGMQCWVHLSDLRSLIVSAEHAVEDAALLDDSVPHDA